MSTNPERKVIAWKPIEGLDQPSGLGNGVLISLDKLRTEWERRLAEWSDHERAEVRARELRRLSVETGILERIYDIDWGTTLTLVASGFAREVVEREDGRVDDGTLATLRAHLSALEMVVDVAKDGRPLTGHFIRELHAAITRTQRTYFAVDSLGNDVEREMVHGQWKTQPNWVSLADGTDVEMCPPEHVTAEIDRLIALWPAIETSAPPIVAAAWLHHRFVQIHPFADGNGRVARALVLLVMERHHYAPLVVDRHRRDAYAFALRAAGDGDLQPLVKLFAALEEQALLRELARPDVSVASEGLGIVVARTLAEQIARRRAVDGSKKKNALRARLLKVNGHSEIWFRDRAQERKRLFKSQGLKQVLVDSGSADPTTHADQLRWFRRQIIESAQRAGHYADLRGDCAFCTMRITLPDLGVTMRYAVSFHGVGRDGTVMAGTTFAELEWPGPDGREADRTSIATGEDAFVFLHDTTFADLDERMSTELDVLLERGLAAAEVALITHVSRHT